MAIAIGALTGGIDLLVGKVIIPVTSVVPVLVRTGLLLAGFAALWLAFLVAMAVQPAALDDTWRTVGGLPLIAQGIAWLLFLPQMAGLWVWATDWPLAARVVVILGLAAWNVLVFIPRHEPATAPATD
jgi:hypothetical protein